MIGCNRITQQRERASAFNIADRGWGLGHAFEVGWILYISGVGIPSVDFALRGVDTFPVGVTFEHAVIARLKHGRVDVVDYGILHFRLRWPDILHIDRIAILIIAQRIVEQIEVHIACNRVSNHERWRCQEVVLHQGVDAAFEVAVSR